MSIIANLACTISHYFLWYYCSLFSYFRCINFCGYAGGVVYAIYYILLIYITKPFINLGSSFAITQAAK